jgi:hypothetical protein
VTVNSAASSASRHNQLMSGDHGAPGGSMEHNFRRLVQQGNLSSNCALESLCPRGRSDEPFPDTDKMRWRARSGAESGIELGITPGWQSPGSHSRGRAGGMERLLDLGGKVVATYRPDTDWTYDNTGVRIGTGNRLAGMVEDKQ